MKEIEVKKQANSNFHEMTAIFGNLAVAKNTNFHE